MPKTKKNPDSRARKSTRRVYKGAGIDKKHIRNVDALARVYKRLQNNLGHLVGVLTTGKKSQGKVRAYEDIAARLSKIAGLSNGHVWSWNYIASVHSGSMSPSKKFLRAFDLLSQNIDPRAKRWFYFVRRRSVAAVYDKSILAEVIRARLHELGYKPVTHARYQEIKKHSVRSR